MRLRGRGISTSKIPPIFEPGPLVSMTMRSDNSTASSTSCVTITEVISYSSHSCINCSCRLPLVRASNAPKGSSKSRTFGRMARARAIATRCFIPPDNSLGRLSTAWRRLTRSIYFSTSAFLSSSDSWVRTWSTARVIFSLTVNQGKRE